MALGSAPAKIILFGEHAVVHGIPALAAPVSALRARAEAVPAAHPGVRIYAPGFADALPADLDSNEVDNALAMIVRLVLREFDLTAPALDIHLQSDIPVASGMGSGAAVAAATARALCESVGQAIDPEILNRLVYEVEKLHHGTPSGIDNTVIVYEKPVFFIKGDGPKPLTVGKPFQLAIGDTGNPSSTRAAVAAVWALYDQDRVGVTARFEAIRQLVLSARSYIEAGTPDDLGGLMTKNHALLRELTVSSAELDRLVDAALQAGASGAKLSGGGRGGIMIALVNDATRDRVTKALQNAGAARVVTTEIR